MKETTVKIVTVGTPFSPENDFIVYSQLESSLEIILPNLNNGDVIMLKSTVPSGTTMGIVRQKDIKFQNPYALFFHQRG